MQLAGFPRFRVLARSQSAIAGNRPCAVHKKPAIAGGQRFGRKIIGSEEPESGAHPFDLDAIYADIAEKTVVAVLKQIVVVAPVAHSLADTFNSGLDTGQHDHLQSLV